ncbi:Pre-mRNA-splicing factor cef1 [Ceratobasidium sp. 428]|nr:Pre-mRNA-splicing factor cef1 [Ceratobasidium sp. 428]
MTKEVTKAAKVEKKLNVTLGGYSARSTALAKRIKDGSADLLKTYVEYESFARLHTIEQAAAPRPRIPTKEEQIMMEAEAVNEAALAAIEGTQVFPEILCRSGSFQIRLWQFGHLDGLRCRISRVSCTSFLNEDTFVCAGPAASGDRQLEVLGIEAMWKKSLK